MASKRDLGCIILFLALILRLKWGSGCIILLLAPLWRQKRGAGVHNSVADLLWRQKRGLNNSAPGSSIASETDCKDVI